MKRVVQILACLTVLASIPSTALAQGNGGVIGGLSSTRVQADDDGYENDVGSRAMYSIGLQGLYSFHDYVAAAPQVFFSRRGWSTDRSTAFQDFRADWVFSYLDVALLARLAYPVGGTIAPKFLLGPHGSIFIDGEFEGETSGFINASGDEDIDSDDVNSLQFGITVGAGVDVEIPFGIVTADLRYMHNLTPVFDAESEDDNVYHTSWLLMGGFMF